MNKDSKIYVAGHRGMVGSAIQRKLAQQGFTNIVTRTHKELDLTRQNETESFFDKERPEYVFLAAAKVGGIHANSTYKADFIYQNITIAANIVQASYKTGVKKLLNLGSTCIYPKLAPQPMKEEYLLTGALEPTNDAYAIAKISAIKMCHFYNEQYGTNFMSVMPTNLYGPNDNYHFENSHVLPAFIRKIHLAKALMSNDFAEIIRDFQKHDKNAPVGNDEILKKLKSLGITKGNIALWGSGTPYREFLHADELAEACVFILSKYNAKDLGEFINLGTGKDYPLKEIAAMVKNVVGYEGSFSWDTTKPDGTPKRLSDVSRVNALGWTAKISVPDGIGMVYQEYLAI